MAHFDPTGPKRNLLRINRAGWPFIALFCLMSAGLGMAWLPLSFVGVVLTAWCVYFFRDPDRITPTRDGLIVSPADGVVLPMVEATPPEALGMGPQKRTRVSIFMNIFDVHVNRTPCNGTISAVHYIPGKFVNASLDKASEHNERQAYRLTMTDGRDIAFVQIAGLVARRIKRYVSEEQEMQVGERFGLIRFGSRVDVYLPEGVTPLVAPGQRTLAGETVLADMLSQEAPRCGVIR